MKTPKSYSIEETFKPFSKSQPFQKAYKVRKAEIAKKKKLNKNWPEELISTLDIIKKKQLLRKKKK